MRALLSSCCILWSFALQVAAQQPFFRAFSFPEAHRQVRVNDLVQSSDGYIWLGTTEGLFRFDGQVFQQYSPSFSTSALYEDRQRRIWVGTEQGEIHILEAGGVLSAWSPGFDLPTAAATAFAEDREGRLWIATYGDGLFCLTPSRLLHFPEEGDIYDLDADVHGGIWYGSDQGLHRVQLENDVLAVKRYSLAEGLPDEIVRVVHAGDSAGIWAGMHDGGLCRFNPSTQRVDYAVADWDYGVATALSAFSNKEVWVGTEGKGLYRLDLSSGVLKAISQQDGKPGAKISALLADDEGGVWVAGNAPGFLAANLLFEWIAHPKGDIQAVLADRGGDVWVGSQAGLLRKPAWQDTFFQVLPQIDLNVVSLYEDPFRNIWIGTFGEGAYCYQPSSGKILRIQEGPLLSNGSLLSIDGRGDTLWLATLGGVNEIVLSGNPHGGGRISSRSYGKESGLGTNYIYRVLVDSRGRVWFGADGKGLSVLENGEIQTFTHAGDIPLKAVYSIAEDQKGRIWLTASNRGLFSYDGTAFRHYSLGDGLRNLSISGIAAVGRQLLAVHPGGVDLFDPETGHWLYYDEEVGIPESEPNLNALSTDAEGNVWIGLPDRLLRFSTPPKAIRIHPTTCLESVSVLLDSINWRERSAFSHRENFLIFDYVGIWFTDARSVSYRYRLEGFDRDWIFSRDRRATYSNLPPGEYTFRVSSSENGAFRDEPVVSYQFLIRSPIWERPWFILLSALALSAFIYIMAQRIKRVERLKKESVQSQYETLKSQVNPHFLFNSFNTLIAFIEENPPLAVEYAEKLSDFYRVILAYREKELISLAEELKLTEDFGYLLKKRFGDSITLEIQVEPGPYFVAPLALQILVENAVKHNVAGKDNPLLVRVALEGDYILVANTLQRKTRQEASTGFGLKNIVSRYALLTKRPVLIEERDGEFQVRLPLLK